MLLETPKPVDEGPLRRVELPVPDPAPGELRLRLSACAICRTDLQLCEGDIALRRRPVVPGHQAVGVVDAVGAAVGGWRVGDRAGVAWLAGACGTCGFCATGRENLCEKAEFTGWDRDGGFAEAIAVRADFALPLPSAFADLDAAPLLCGGIIGYRSLKRAGIKPGGRLGLYGFGASAYIAIQVARHWGCEVYVASRSEDDLRRARAMGAAWTGAYDDMPPAPLDAAVTFAPAGEVVVAALRATGRGGTVAVNAIHLDRVPEFPYDLLWWERSLVSVANFTRQDAREFLELAASIPLSTRVEPFPLESANETLALLKAGGVEGSAVLTIV